MLVDIQYTDGTRESVDHADFYKTIKNRDIYRFSIGTADFYNHEEYYIDILPDRLKIYMVDPPGVYPEGPHACVFEVFSPTKWQRTQYGSGADPATTLPFDQLVLPQSRLKIVGVGVDDTTSDQLRADWPITKLSDYSKEGV